MPALLYNVLNDANPQSPSSFNPTGLASSPSGRSTPFSDAIQTPITPAPIHPRHRLRVNYAHKRIAHLAKKGMEELDQDDDDEVDELADDDELFEWRKSAGTGQEESDPFWDEAEL